MASIDTARIDQTARTLAAAQRPSLWTLPLRVLPTWAQLALALAGLYYASQLWHGHQLRRRAARYALDRRRKAGIPDDDRREFRLAAADVLRARKAQDDQRERERALQRRAAKGQHGHWERFGEAHGLRERPTSQQPLREASATPSIRYPSLVPQSSAGAARPSAFSFGEAGGPLGDSDDERQELLVRGELARRARGEGFGDEPILPPQAASPAPPKALFPARPAAKRSLTSSSISSHTAVADGTDPSKRIKVKQEPASDDAVDLSSTAAGGPAGRTRKRDADDEAGEQDELDERAQDDGGEDYEDELMSSGSERLVQHPHPRAAAPRKKLRRQRGRSRSAGSSEQASEADMGSASDAPDELATDDDDDDRSMTSGSERSRSPSPPPLRPAARKAQAHKRGLSEVGSVSSSRPRPSLAKKRRKPTLGASAGADARGSGSPAAPSPAGDRPPSGSAASSWEDAHGIKFRTGADGRGSERLVLVKKQVRRFDMPADSEHPDRAQTMRATVETWVNEDEFAALKARRELAWQSDDDDDGESKVDGSAKVLEQLDPSVAEGLNAVLFSSTSLGRSAARKPNLYQAKPSASTPLRPSQSLSQMHDLYTSAGLFSTASSRPASPASSAGGGTPKTGRLRFASAAARVRAGPLGASGTSLARQAKEAEELKRHDEALAKKVEEEKQAKAAAVKPVPAPAPAPAPAPPTASTPAPASTPSAPSFSFGGPSKEPSSSSSSLTPAPAAPGPTSGASNSLAASPASTPAPSTSNPFASRPAATPQQPSEPPKPSPLGGGSASAGGFSFGAPSKPADAPPPPAKSAPAAALKASFSFGAAPASSTPAPAPASAAKPPAFAFAAPSSAPTPPPSTPAEPTTKAPSFSFGAPAPSPAAAAPASTAPKSFSFGASSNAGPAAVPQPTAAKSFSFGAPASASPSAPSTPAAISSAPSFSFGASAPSSSTPAAAAAAAAAPTFGAPSASPFGAPPAPYPLGGGPAATSSSAPPFSFGVGAGSGSTSAPSFGGASSTPSTFGGAPATPTAFGGGSTSAPSFGSSTPASATSAPKFSFGAPSAPAASSPAPAFGAPATFSFGAKPADGAAAPAPAPKTSFSFGGGGSGGFSFGK